MITKVLIVDDHPLIRQGMKTFLMAEKDFEVCGEASTASEAIKCINIDMPDIVSVDLSLEGETSGLELLNFLTKKFPAVKTIVISMHDEGIFAERSLHAGARGYLMKNDAHANIVTAIRKVMAGEVFVSQRVSGLMIEKIVDNPKGKKSNSIESLGNKEFEIFLLMSEGFSNSREIAKKMNISRHTVDSHKSHIREKLNLKNSQELSRFAVQWANAKKF